MVKICQTGLQKFNFEIIPKKLIFRFLPKISAGHGWSWKIFFANFQILGPLGCQGWVVIPQIVKKKSKSLHPSTQAWNFFLTFFAETETIWSQGPNRIRIGRDIRLLNISAHAQHAMKSVPSMLSLRWNSFRVCSVCDKIRSAYAQHRLYM